MAKVPTNQNNTPIPIAVDEQGKRAKRDVPGRGHPGQQDGKNRSGARSCDEPVDEAEHERAAHAKAARLCEPVLQADGRARSNKPNMLNAITVNKVDESPEDPGARQRASKCASGQCRDHPERREQRRDAQNKGGREQRRLARGSRPASRQTR